MIDKLFCDFLEYKICELFNDFYNEETQGFWCDGIVMTHADYSYTKKSVNDNRKMNFLAFVGKDGQQEYEMTLKLGNRAFSRFARGLDIKDCFPTSENRSFFSINTISKKIEISLE
jgi:hypothetical protein